MPKTARRSILPTKRPWSSAYSRWPAAACGRRSASASFRTLVGKTEDGQTTAGAVACIAREHAYWDRLLNQSYGRIREGAGEDDSRELRDLQRQWLAWRAARCAYEAERFEGGTFANVVANLCFTQETARRAIDLTAMLLEGGDHYRLDE